MTNHVTRKTVRIISFSLAVCVIFGGTTISGYRLAEHYRTNLEYTYVRAMDDLSDYLSNLETTLTKGLYANTAPQQYGITQKLARDSDGAKASLGQLPLSDVELDSVNKFVAQVGDYATYLSDRLAKGGKITPEEMDSLARLGEYAKTLNADMKDLQARFDGGEAIIGETVAVYKNLEETSDEKQEPLINSGFREMNEGFTDYPTLIYDGPFSDHMTKMQSKMLQDVPEVTEQEALSTAARFTTMAEDQIKPSGETAGNLPTYTFSGENITVAVTKAGGHVDTMLNSRAIGEPQMGYEQASASAKKFLEEYDIRQLTESYYVINDGICTINYAYENEGVVFYSDLIKVSVALDNGEIVAYNATGYLMNHIARSMPEAQISMEKAKNVLSPRLTVENERLACIPTSGANEIFCYEFTCSSDNGDRVLVYINTVSGLEEQIYVVLQSDGGVLVM